MIRLAGWLNAPQSVESVCGKNRGPGNKSVLAFANARSTLGTHGARPQRQHPRGLPVKQRRLGGAEDLEQPRPGSEFAHSILFWAPLEAESMLFLLSISFWTFVDETASQTYEQCNCKRHSATCNRNVTSHELSKSLQLGCYLLQPICSLEHMRTLRSQRLNPMRHSRYTFGHRGQWRGN